MTHKRTDSAPSAQRVWRQDAGEELAPGVRTAQGFLLCQGIVVRPGVQVYRDALGGERRELILPEEIAKIDSLASLGRAPVTLDHPEDDVSPENIASLGVGDADGDVIVTSGGFIKISLAVRRKDALDAIHVGKQELSPGYTCRIEPSSGVHPIYGAYDAIQRDRIYNHIAIVDRARGGSEVRLRADRKDAAYQVTTPPSSGAQRPHQEARMALTAEEKIEIAKLMGDVIRKDTDDKQMKDAYVTKEDFESFKKDMLAAVKEGGKPKTDEGGKPTDVEDEDAPADKKADAADPTKIALQILELRQRADALGVTVEATATPAQLRKAIVLASVPTARKDAKDAYYATLMDALPASGAAPSSALPVVNPYTPPANAQQRQDSRPVDTRSAAFDGLRKMSA